MLAVLVSDQERALIQFKIPSHPTLRPLLRAPQILMEFMSSLLMHSCTKTVGKDTDVTVH